MTTLSLHDAARQAATLPALVTAERSLDFAALAARVDRAAAWLASQGVAAASSEPVGLVMTTELATVELFWALFRLGRPILLLGARAPQHARESLLARTGATLIDSASFRSAAATFDASLGSVPPAVSPEAPRVLVPTSGTTGEPKIAVLSERALLASARAHFDNCEIAPNDAWLCCLPLAHVSGLSILTRSLYARRPVVLFEHEGALRDHVPELGDAIERSSASFVSLVPTLLGDLLAAGFRPPPALRAVLLGGASCSRALLERAHGARVPVLPSYGLTEACSQVATRAYARRLDAPDANGRIPSSGHPLASVRVRIGPDETIEIYGPTLQNGYWDEPAPLTPDEYFRTSDRGLLTSEGELVVTGRRDDAIVTGGEKVDPLAVEAVLLSVPGVLAACVFGEPDETWGNVVAAAIVAEPAGFSQEALLEQCALRLAAHERPRRLALLSALRQTEGGKLDREATRRAARSELRALATGRRA